MKTAYLIASSMLCLGLLSCQQRSGPPVRIVLPDRFRGPVHIVEDKAGVLITLQNNEYVYVIPPSGKLAVRRAVGFSEWHQAYASYRSGLPLPVLLTNDPEQREGEVALYELGGLSFFVGSRSELTEFLSRPPAETKAQRFWSGQWTTNGQRR